MARIIHVKKAQQRYATVPLIDPETGEPKVVEVRNKRTGQQKITKRGKPVTMKITVSDKNQPLKPYTCEHCRLPIEVGTPYKHVTIKSGPYGGYTKRRHEKCPTWRPSELSTSKMAGVYAAQEDWDDFLSSDYESMDDVTDALANMAEAVRGVAMEYEESADNIRDGFGHDTFMSEELMEKSESLNQWADDIENADVPDPEDEQFAMECDTCGGTGTVDCDNCDGTGLIREEGVADEDCSECDAAGERTCDECDGDGKSSDPDYDTWRDAVSELSEPMDCPV